MKNTLKKRFSFAFLDFVCFIKSINSLIIFKTIFRPGESMEILNNQLCSKKTFFWNFSFGRNFFLTNCCHALQNFIILTLQGNFFLIFHFLNFNICLFVFFFFILFLKPKFNLQTIILFGLFWENFFYNSFHVLFSCIKALFVFFLFISLTVKLLF